MYSSETKLCFITNEEENANDGFEVFSSQKEAFENANNKNHTFYFAIDKGISGKKEYGSCLNSKVFIDIYNDMEPKCFYELLNENSAVHEYYDIDLKAENNTLNKSPEQIFLRFDAIRKDFINVDFNSNENNLLTDWRITDSSKRNKDGIWKVSLHLVNRKVIWKNNWVTKTWYKIFQEFVKSFYNEEIFDKAVDSKNRAMRIIHSCKASDLKRPLEQAIWKHGTSKLPLVDFLIQAEDTIVNRNMATYFKVELIQFMESKKLSGEKEQKQRVLKENEIPDDKCSIKDDGEDEVETLVNLITDKIKQSSHSLCSDNKPQIEYKNFRSLCFAYLSTFGKIEDDQVYSFILSDIWPYYRSKDDHKPEAIINCIINGVKQNQHRENKYTIKSLHYWAIENEDYDKYFGKKEIKHSTAVFNEDENFFWGDFVSVIISTVFESQEELEKYVIQNINKVCVIIQEESPVFFLKMESSIKAYTLKSCTSFGYACKFYNKKKKEEVLKLDTVIKGNLNLIKRHNCFVYRPYGVTKPNIKDEIFNTFTGFKAKLKPSSLLQKPEDKCDLILKHIKEVLCANDDDKNDYFLTWLSHIIQFPEKKTKVMLILYSQEQQAGKGIIAEKLVTSVFGMDNSTKTPSINDLVGDFNNLLSNKVFVVIDEANSDPVTNMKVQKLKSIITDQVQTTQQKYFDVTQSIDYSNFMLLTNEANAMKIEAQDKRTCVFKVSGHRINDRQYFKDLNDQLEDKDAIDYFYTYLFNYKSTRHISDIPDTVERQDMMMLTAEQPIKFFNDVKENNYELNERFITRIRNDENDNKGVWITNSVLYDRFLDWVVCTGEKQGIYSLPKFNKFAKNMFGDYKFFNEDRKRKFNIQIISPTLE